MLIRELTAAEYARAAELFSIAFEMELTEKQLAPLSEKSHFWGAFDREEMTSFLKARAFPMSFDGSPCLMAGIGGVSTLPQYRMQGGIRNIFREALPQMYREGMDFSYLYPFCNTFYRKFGYENAVQKLLVTLNLSRLTVLPTGGTFRLADSRHPMTEAVRQLDRQWEQTYNLMVQHDLSAYDWLTSADPAASQEFTYVYFDAADTPKGYLTYRKADGPAGRDLVCSRFCFADREGFQGLLGFFQSVSTDHARALFHLPDSTAMQYLLREWTCLRFTLEPAGMVRVINAAAVLKKARYLGSGCLTLEVQDAQIPENNAVFSVAFRDGRCVKAEPCDRSPDAVLDISTFSALIAGVCEFSQAAAWMNGLEIRNPNACFDQVFYRKPMMIVDFF